MKSLLLSFCLIAAAVSALTTPNPTRVANVEAVDTMGAAIPSSVNCIPSKQIAVAQAQHEVHAVVVDMPQPASLEYASPDTWGALPTFDPPDEESPTKPVLQVVLN
jgi:hypothetical protein